FAQIGNDATCLTQQAAHGLAQASSATNLLSQASCGVHNRSDYGIQCLAQLAAGILQSDWQNVVDGFTDIIQRGFQWSWSASGRIAAVVAATVVTTAVVTTAVVAAT